MPAARKGKTQFYDVVVHIRVEVSESGYVALNTDSVAAAVRQNIKMNLPNNWSISGLRYDHGFTDVSATPVLSSEQKEEVS